MKYRAEIDGLRALAVVPVILFHAGFEFFSGGFIGVDLFFVISGYLITTILIDDIHNNRFSIHNFYERRAKRILPVLLFIIIVCVFFAWVLLPETELSKFGNGLIGISVFASNFVFWKGQGYFDESAELNPLLHTWSLSVEEQFYLLFPVFLVLGWRLGKNKLFFMIVTIAILSLLISEWGWRNNPSANFYLLPTRAWELLAGSIAAFIVQNQGIKTNNSIAMFGVFLILFSFIVFDKSIPFPSVFAFLPVSGVVLIILFASNDTFVGKLLSNKVLTSIGLISYSAYLWHQPLFAFYRVHTQQITLSIFVALFLVIITFSLSYLSWRFIEKPTRIFKFKNKSSFYFISIGSLIVIFGLGYILKLATEYKEYRLAYNLSQNDYVYFSNMDERKFTEARLFYSLNPVNTIVIGSSRVMQISSNLMSEKIYNLSVSGATLEDDIAIALEALAKLDYDNIYISADPWILNKNDELNRYKSINELYQYWIDSINANKPPAQFLTTKTRKSDFSNINDGLAFLRRDEIFPTNNKNEVFDKKSYDGQHIYNRSYVSTSRNSKSNFDRILNFGMRDFEYDQESINKFQAFVSYLKSNDVNVSLVLSPYHPVLYKQMITEKPIFLEIEDWFRDFAEKNTIRIIGAYDGAQLGCSERDFYDGMHPKMSCMKNLFKNKF